MIDSFPMVFNPDVPTGHLAGRLCPLCGSAGTEIGMAGSYPIRECCRIGLSFPWETEEEYTDFYQHPTAYHEGETRKIGVKPTFARDTEHLESGLSRAQILRHLYPKHRTLMDVGCGSGAFVTMAACCGLVAAGMEPCLPMVELARRIGRNVVLGRWQDVGSEYDIITLLDVLEHLTRPEACLRHLRDRLTPEGVILVEMPEWRSLHHARDFLGWKHLKPRQHIALYSETAARTLFANCGLRTENIIRPCAGTIGKCAYYLRSDD